MLAILTEMDPRNAIALIALVVFSLLCAMVGCLLLVMMPSQRILQEWARRKSFTLEAAQRRTLFRGPFSLHSTGLVVYRITVKMSSGHIRQGYARVGNVFGFGSRVEVKWDRGPESDADDADVGNIG